MYRRLLLLLLAPTVAIVLLVGLIARSEHAKVAEAEAVAHLAELAARATALDTALGAETVAVANPQNVPEIVRRAADSNTMLDALQEHALTSVTSTGHINTALAVIDETLRYRSDAVNGVISPLQAADRYATARTALRDAIAAEALLASPERRTTDVTALLALVNARSAHIDERLAVALAIRYETWAPGQQGVVVGAIERQRVHLEQVRSVTPNLAPLPPTGLTQVRESLLKGADVPAVSSAEWTDMSAVWSSALTQAVETQTRDVSVDAREAARDANRSLWLSLLGAAIAAAVIIGTAFSSSLRLARRVGTISDAASQLAANPNRPIALKDHRGDELGELARSFGQMAEQVRQSSRRQRLEATALESIVQKRPLSQILRTCNALVTPRGRFESGPEGVAFVKSNGQRKTLDATLFVNEPELQVAVDLVIMAERRSTDLADLEQRANFDSLTGLPNRAVAIGTLEAACRTAGNCRPAILFLDLDGFKAVNDDHGHDRGDEVLRSVANALVATVGDQGLVGRMGGDEFIVIITHPMEHQLATLARRVRSALTRVPTPQGIALDTSIGIATQRRGQTHNQLLTDADAAMYEAKGSALRIVESTTSLRETQRVRHDRERHLMRTLIDGEIRAAYQPIWDSSGTTLLALEALARPVDGFGPGGAQAFFADAERLGLAADFDRRMLRNVLECIADWRRQGLPTVPVAVNLSAQTLARPTLVNEVEQLLAATRCTPSDLILEVTEDGVIADIEATAERLRRLRAIGVRVAIDDFGTGYSSLAYVARLPIDILKLDRELISGIDHNHTNRQIVETVIRLADVLGVSVVAEGIERDEERHTLATMGCSMMQGYMLARPETARVAAKRLNDRASKLAVPS